jgi:hypothetical protein
MRLYKTIELPRSKDLPAYHAYLKTVVYPLVEGLREANLIEAYDFLTHGDGSPHIDLRFWITAKANEAEVVNVLKERGLPSQLRDGVQAEPDPDRELILRLLHNGAEQIRALISDSRGLCTIEEVVHWLLNQYGMGNAAESAWHAKESEAWKTELAPF